VLAFSQSFSSKELATQLVTPAMMQSYITRVALDDRYANKFAPLDSTAMYHKLSHQLLYTPMTGEMEMP
jgi:hypothetical protein